MNLQWSFKWTRRVAALTGLLSCPALASAQGCAMCYTSAAAAKAGAVQALRSGILILLLPALAMFAGIFVVIYRSRNRFNGAADWTAERDREWRELLQEVESRKSRVESNDLVLCRVQVEKSRVESRE
jgi:hypothetical protein